MSLLRLAFAHLDLTCSVLVVLLQSFALADRGKDRWSSPRGWLDLAIWAFSFLAVILGGRSALGTAHLLDSLKNEATLTGAVSQEAHSDAESSLLESKGASDRAKDAMKKADNAEMQASSAQKFSKQARDSALRSLQFTHTAQAEIDAQRRALRSVQVKLDLSGPLPPRYGGPSFSYGNEKDLPSIYLYPAAANAKESVSLRLGGVMIMHAGSGHWEFSLNTRIIDSGFPLGEDVRSLGVYRSVCVDLASFLGEIGLSTGNPPLAFASMNVSVSIEVNGRTMQRPESFSGLYASSNRTADNKPLYCLTLDESLDDIYESR